MAIKFSIYRLLQLPPSLRCLAISPLTRSRLESRILNLTNESIRTRLLSTTKQSLSKQPPKPKVSTAKSPSTSRSKPPPPTSSPTPPTPSSPGSSSSLRMDTTLQRLLKSTGRVLIYRAPSHTSFYVTSYLFGGIFIFSSYLSAGDLNPARNLSWNVRAATTALALVLAGMGTLFLIAPSKLIRTVSLVVGSQGGAPAVVRFEMRSAIPFLHRLRGKGGYVLEASADEIAISSRIRSDNMAYINVPPSSAQDFTEAFSSHSLPSSPSSVGSRLRNFNTSLLNFWPTLKADVARMFVRDGFAYVRIGVNGRPWKLDFRDAMVLDHARPLRAVMRREEAERGIAGWVRNMWGS